MTRPDHLSGTDRVAEAASASNAQIVVNIQGDEPMIDPAAIDAAVLGILDDPEADMGTLKTRIFNEADVNDPNVVKVVTDARDNALYFSRSAIPFVRDPGNFVRESGERVTNNVAHFKHIGLYVYRRGFPVGLPGSAGGASRTWAERLEQLEGAGKRIHDSRGGDGLRFGGR